MARLVEALRASPAFLPHLSLVALHDEQVVGHVMISYAELQDGPARRPRTYTATFGKGRR